MNKSPPVFYLTLSPLGPLLCFPSVKFTIMQSRATGIADHVLPLGDLLTLRLTLNDLPPSLVSGSHSRRRVSTFSASAPKIHAFLPFRHLGSRRSSRLTSCWRKAVISFISSFSTNGVPTRFGSTDSLFQLRHRLP